MLELQHLIISIFGIRFKDLFPRIFCLVFLTYVFKTLAVIQCSTGIWTSKHTQNLLFASNLKDTF